MPITKKLTLDFIEEQLQLSCQKMDLLKQLQSEGRPARLNELEFLGKIQRTNSGILALALEHETNQAIDIEYQPFLLESDRQKDLFADFLAGIPDGREYRFNFIIGGRGLHATPVVIDSDGSQVRIFSLDAALYYDNFNCVEIFALATKAKTYQYTGGGIQNSSFGCSIYSIGHLREMAKMNANELEDMFSNAMSRKTNQYIGFRPEFVTNMQSIGGMICYLTENPEAAIVAESTELNTQTVFDGRSIKMRNYAITAQNHEVLTRASEMLQVLSEEEFQTIFENKTGKQALEQAYVDLSPNQITKVNGIYNLDKIAVILDCDFQQAENSRCFGPRREDSIIAASIIRKAYIQKYAEIPEIIHNLSGPQLELLRQRHLPIIRTSIEQEEGWKGKKYLFDLQVLEAFKRGTEPELIKECNNAYAIEAISKYHIDPALANNAVCFEDPKNQSIAISFMRKAYAETKEGQKESQAKAVFFKIKDNPCSLNHEIAALYKEAIKTCPSPAGIADGIHNEEKILDRRATPGPLKMGKWEEREIERTAQSQPSYSLFEF